MTDIIGAAAQPDLIKDATIESFEDDVLRASMEVPVIVDFWATWCGPCKQLAPALEKVVSEAGGAVKLVKVDIDKNQMLANQLRIQSVPTVYAFFQGRPVDGFQGALPESQIRQFVDRLKELGGGAAGAQTAQIEEILDAAAAAFESGAVSEAAAAYGEILGALGEDFENEHVLRAAAGLAQCQLAAGETEQARSIIGMIPEAKQSLPAVAKVIAALDLAAPAGGDDEAAAFEQRVAADPADLEARFALAEHLAGKRRMEEAIDALLELISRDRDWNEGAARAKLLKIFEALGPTDKLTLSGRRRFSSILFS